jgi:hypothetical protein
MQCQLNGKQELAAESGESMSRGPRRNRTPAFETKIVLAVIEGDRILAPLSEQPNAHVNPMTALTTRLHERAADVFGLGSHATAGGGHRHVCAPVDDLYRYLVPAGNSIRRLRCQQPSRR